MEVADREPDGLLRVRNVHEPTLTFYPARPEAVSRGTIVICPGGAYGLLSMEHEGSLMASRFNAAGWNAFVLKYRMAPYRHPIPLMDAQQAMRRVRGLASEWDLDPERVGILGFSAGGHLAATVLTRGDRPVPVPGLGTLAGGHADFGLLGYPVISLVGPAAHIGSAQNLLGANPDRSLCEDLSADRQVTARTPPTFLFHARDDVGVPPENSFLFSDALRRAGVSTEVFLLDTGGHGFGLRRDEWVDPCLRWLNSVLRA